MKTSEVLIKAQELIRDPGKWCQGAFERDGAYCALGALGWRFRCVDRIPNEGVVYEYLQPIVDALVGRHWTVSSYNDSHSHADVMDLFDIAISAAMSDEAVE